MDSTERSLAAIELLKPLPAVELRQIETRCQWHDYLPDETIIERGQTNQDVYFLLAGRAHVLNFSSSGRAVAFASLGPGQYFGELAAIDGRPRSANVVAATPCRAASLSAREFRLLVASYPDIAFALLKGLAEVVRSGDDRIFDLTSLAPLQRVCIQLLRLAKAEPSGSENWSISPLPTQAVLAAGADTTRETVARILGRLSARVIVQRSSRTLKILDRNRLETLALKGEGEQPGPTGL